MNLNKGFYIINFVDSSFITYYSNKNFYFSKKYVDQYDLYMKFKKTDNFYIISENNLLENIKEELMQLHIKYMQKYNLCKSFKTNKINKN